MRASEGDGQSLILRMNTFLSKYRSTPHATTGLTPTELFLGRKVRTKLDLLKPKIAEAVESKQLEQKKHYDRHSKLCSFSNGQTVSVRDCLSSKKWVSGVITSILGPTMYKVKLPNGSLVVRHVDQLCDRLPADQPSAGRSIQVLHSRLNYSTFRHYNTNQAHVDALNACD